MWHFFSAVFHMIFFIFAGNEDMHKSSEEFESDPTTDNRVSNRENGVATFSRLFLIGSF